MNQSMPLPGKSYCTSKMAKNFSVDSTLFKAKAKKLVRKLKLDEPTVVREQAGLLAQLLSKVTPPFKSFPKMSGKPTYTTGGAMGVGKAAGPRWLLFGCKENGNSYKMDRQEYALSY